MFTSLLLAVDVNDLEGAKRSTKAAFRLAQTEGAVLHVLNVLPDSGMPIVSASMDATHSQSLREAATKALSDWIADNAPDGVDVKPHVVFGTVYDQIIKIADALDVSAIIVGAHRPELKDYLIGPNAARVARHAQQSVFVVR